LRLKELIPQGRIFRVPNSINAVCILSCDLLVYYLDFVFGAHALYHGVESRKELLGGYIGVELLDAEVVGFVESVYDPDKSRVEVGLVELIV
jgi:hypothetical protein